MSPTNSQCKKAPRLVVVRGKLNAVGSRFESLTPPSALQNIFFCFFFFRFCFINLITLPLTSQRALGFRIPCYRRPEPLLPPSTPNPLLPLSRRGLSSLSEPATHSRSHGHQRSQSPRRQAIHYKLYFHFPFIFPLVSRGQEQI